MPHDFDTILGQGDTAGVIGESIFQPILTPESTNPAERANFLQRFMRHPEFVPIYFRELKRLGETVFAPTNLNPLVDQLLSDWPASTTMPAIKTFNASRVANVLSQIPLTYSVVHTLALSNGVPRSTTATISLRGTANAIDARTVRVNGSAGVYSAWEGRWTNSTVTLQPGLNNLLVEAVGANNDVVWSTNFVVWYDNGTFNNVSGSLAGNTVWSPGAGPYRVTGNITIPSGATLTIQPGTTVYFNAGVGITVANGGRILAEGNANARIQFNIVPGPVNRWSGIVINGAVGSIASRITYAHIEGNSGTAIDVNAGDAFLDHLTFGTTDRRYLDLDGASFIVSHCVFPNATASFEAVHGSAGIRSGGRGIFVRNFFGSVNGYQDTVDFTGGNRPGPIVQFLDNVFIGSDDDILDLDGTDAWIEGNIFLRVHRNGSPDSASAISGGNDSGQTSEITVVGNLFYDVDQAATAKQGNFYNFINNTVVRQSGAGFEDAGITAVLNFADDTYALALGMYVEGNIFFDVERLTRYVTNGTPLFNNITFNNNLMPFAWAGAGTNNSTAHPQLNYVPQLAETTGFNSWESAQVLWDWFALRAGSPGIGTGPNGRDKGGVIPLGASISGEPAGTNSQNSATLRVGANRTGNGIPAGGFAFPNGSGYTHYKWRLDNGPWSAETVSSTPITLNNLGPGQHRVDVVGRRDAGLYQDDTNYGPVALVTQSRTWFVNTNTSVVRINEILASNTGGFVHSNTTPDAIELHNASAAPVNLEGMRLTDDPADPDKFIFGAAASIPAGGYLVVFADSGITPGIHLGYTLAAEGESLYLYDSVESGGALLDAVTFGLQLPDLSVGRVADGSWNLCQPTLGAANVARATGDPLRLKINEWLAAEFSLFQNDFIELYNQDSLPVALGGLFLTEEPIGWPNQHQITALSFIGGGGYRSFVADGDPQDGADHLNFTLTPEQGIIGLMNRDLSMIDCVVYGSQRVDISQGRSPNGSSNIVFFAQPTPGAPNQSALNTNSGVVINEVLANNGSWLEADGSTPDWVEFHNLSGSTVDISDMSFTDSTLVPRRYVFAPGTTIGPVGYLRLRCDPDAPVSTTNCGFGLKATGGSVYLFDKAVNGGGLVSAISHGLQPVDFSIGRVPNGSTNWVLTLPTPNAANSAAVLGNVSLLKINEWMAAPNAGEDDWFELYNTNVQPVAVGGMYLTDTLANRTKSQIPALSFIGGGTNGWQRFWADSNPGAGADHVNFALGAGGEAIGFSASASELIDSVTFGAQQTDVSEGRFPDGSAAVVRFPLTPSPGDANYLLLSNVVVNETLTHTDPPLEDAIELRNLTGANVNIGDWWLSDSKNILKKYRIPAGTIIPANGYVVFYEYQFNADTNDPSAFSLSSAKGDDIYLSAATAGGALTGFRAIASFGAAANGVSFGRYVSSEGNEQFVAMSARSLGQDDPGTVAQFRTGTGLANPYPKVGPVVIAQIMYRPPDVGTNDNTLDEFVELRNITGSPAPLYDPAFPTNTWRFRDGMDFDFPPSVSLPPNGRLVVVSFDPALNPLQLAAFRSKYGVDGTVPIYGPYIGKLANGDDKVELYKPDSPDAGSVPYVLADRVHYYDLAPWTPFADGTGGSLQRISLTGFGNDPTNWVAALPNFGGAADTDGDGIPNSWEMQYGLDPGNAADANQDSDGDGMTNLQEYLAGTSPIDSNSQLKILTVQKLGVNTSRLTFSAVSNKTYSVLFKNAL
ncbi:MAG TPA: lamin tail domain-containing protein, partial [Methylomirabilota bacterium]|nr:lamin tail domain-containing protein [Methylomirabilota bacterium]